jgi:hypothetical protein
MLEILNLYERTLLEAFKSIFFIFAKMWCFFYEFYYLLCMY